MIAGTQQPATPRIALFGGTFDPPHRGHLAIATAAADAFELTTVFFAPTARQPLKPDHAEAGFDDRLTMVALACATDARFAVSNLDAPQPDGSPNYTVRTLGLLAALFPLAEIFTIVGADSFASLARWHQPDRLLALAQWIVVSRPGVEGFDRARPDQVADPAGLTLTNAQRARIHSVDNVHDEVSATELRERLHAGADCAGLIPQTVASYIAARGLYLRQR